MATTSFLDLSSLFCQMSLSWNVLWQALDAINIEEVRRDYEQAAPFPHVAIDNFLPSEIAHSLEQDCRTAQATHDASNNFTQKGKVALEDWQAMPETIAFMCAFFNSGPFINFLEKGTGISNLISDPHLQGGGMHRTERGGFLKMHTDFNWNAQLKLHRRVNILFYLNKYYHRSWKGELMLSISPSREDTRTMQSIEPIANRLVIFNTNDTTFHGHPIPHEFPEDFPRTSLAFYYYTSEPAPRFHRRRLQSTTTRYIQSRNDALSPNAVSLKTLLGYHLRRWLPFS